MTRAPIVEVAKLPGVFVFRDECALVDELLLFENAPVTGVLAQPVERPNIEGRYVSLDGYLEGRRMGPWSDAPLDIDTAFCFVEDPDEDWLEADAATTATLRLNGEGCYALQAARSPYDEFRVSSSGTLLGMSRALTTSPQGEGRGKWSWAEDGQLKSAGFWFGASSAHLTFALDSARLTNVNVSGSYWEHAAEADDTSYWVLRSLQELLDFEAAEALRIRHLAGGKSIPPDRLSTWLAPVRNLTCMQPDTALIRRLVESATLTSLTLPPLWPLGYPTRSSVPLRNAELFDVARDFLRSDPLSRVDFQGQELMVDSEQVSAPRSYGDVLLLDQDIDELVAANVRGEFNSVSEELLASTTKLEFVHLEDLRNKHHEKARTIAREHPQATVFHQRRSIGASWLPPLPESDGTPADPYRHWLEHRSLR